MLRDSGLQQAIEAAGGVGALSRTLGIAQPSVSNWQRVPAERVRAVEAATGVPRGALHADLYPPEGPALDDVDRARAQEYALLALVLGRTASPDLLARLADLEGDASPLGEAHAALAAAAQATDAAAVADEYFALFVGLGRGELLPYASYYLTGFLHERPLARVRADLDALAVRRDAAVSEPEDHVALLCETMSGLIAGRFAAPGIGEREFFARHLEPWTGRFFADLEGAKAARFYRAVGAVGRRFMEIETEAFTLPA